jgi:hypothetical protein
MFAPDIQIGCHHWWVSIEIWMVLATHLGLLMCNIHFTLPVFVQPSQEDPVRSSK